MLTFLIDILSAPLNDFIAPGVFKPESIAQIGTQHLGDIAISPAYVKRQMDRDEKDFKAGELEDEEDAGVSKAMGVKFTLEERLPLLLIHGLLHMVGYDHEEDGDWEIMARKEEEIINAMEARVWSQRRLLSSYNSNRTEELEH